MWSNKHFRLFITSQICFFILSIFLTVLVNNWNNTIYQKEIIKNNRIIIGNILVKHPDLEREIIESIILNNGNEALGQEILKKYGLDNYEMLEYLDSVKTISKTTFYRTIFLNVFLFLLLFFSNLFYLHYIYKKIEYIDTYMNRILNGNYDLAIKDNKEGDISNLKNDIYKMTIKLKEQTEASIKDKQYLESILSDISHQLNTPLTSMYMINDLLQEDLDPKLKKEFLTKNKNQLIRIEWLVTSLLKMSRLDSGMIILKRENVQLASLIDKALEPLLIPLELKNISLEKKIPSDLVFLCDEGWTREALINIIKNAGEHTFNNGTITLEASTNPIYTEIRIKDTGNGISKKDAPHIFERFYKGEGNKDSIGIGLNMAKSIIEKQNGSISFETEYQKGTTFIIKFYKV